MLRKLKYSGTASLGSLASAVLAVMCISLLALAPTSAMAQPTPSSIWDFFGDGIGDPYSSVFLHQMFGPLFPSGTGTNTPSLFSSIITYFNVIVLLIGGAMFFYNVAVGVMQSAHEGQVLGSRWSSLWAPLRIIFAIGMLVPVNSGYNLAQSGVAFVVQGSTKMASALWVATADLVLAGDLPISAPVVKFDPDLMVKLWDQSACIVTLDRQVQIANPAARVGYMPPVIQDDRMTRFTGIYNGSEWVDAGICGQWSTPDTPLYLTNIVDGIASSTVANANIAAGTANQILTTFRDGHRAIMDGISSDMMAIAAANYDALSGSEISQPDITSDIATIHTGANVDMSELVTNLRALATEGSSGMQRPRDQLLNRIKGSDACFAENGSLSGASDGREAQVGCYGEGWMGAGSWYILIAKINNELSSLSDAQSSAEGPSYKSAVMGLDTGDVYRSAVNAGIFTRTNTAGMPSREQTLDVLDRYAETFQNAAIQLAALGYSFPAYILSDIAEQTEGAGFWSKITRDAMVGATEFFVGYFDPGKDEADPMIGLINMGHWLINIGTGILVLVAGTGFFTGGGAAVALLPVYSLFLSSGVTLSFILPVLPFLYWVLAISGYFLLITEAIIAVNLWALSHLRMDGEGISGDAGKMGWLMILSLFMTPTLMVFGFLIGMTLFRIVSDLISAGLFYAVASIIDANPIIWLFGTLGYVILTVSAYIILLERSFSLVSEFPNRVMQWMGSQIQIGGGEGAVKLAAGAAALGVNHIGNDIEKGMGKTNAQGKFIKGSGIGGRLHRFGDRNSTKAGQKGVSGK